MIELCERCLEKERVYCKRFAGQTRFPYIPDRRIIFLRGWKRGQLSQPIEQCPIVKGGIDPAGFWGGKVYEILGEKLVEVSGDQVEEPREPSTLTTDYTYDED